MGDFGGMEDKDGDKTRMATSDDGRQSRRVFTGLKAARGQTFQSGAWRCGAQAVPPAMITSLLTSTVYTTPPQTRANGTVYGDVDGRAPAASSDVRGCYKWSWKS